MKMVLRSVRWRERQRDWGDGDSAERAHGSFEFARSIGCSQTCCHTATKEGVLVAGSDISCNALYFPHGRHKLGGVFCRLELGHDGVHWCEAQDEMDS